MTRTFAYRKTFRIGDWVLHSSMGKLEDAHRVERIESDGFMHFACGSGGLMSSFRILASYPNKCRKCRLAPFKVYMDLRKVARVVGEKQ